MIRCNSLFIFVISAFLLVLVGSPIFFLVSPPQSYVFFIFFSILAVLIALTISGKNIHLKLQLKIKRTQIYLFFTVISAALVVFELADVHVQAINAFLYIFVSVFVLGFSLQSFFKFKPVNSRIESLAIAFPLSLAFLALLSTILFVLPSVIRGQTLSIVLLMISLTALALEKKQEQSRVVDNSVRDLSLNGLLILLFTLGFFAFVFMCLYPQISSLVYEDIAGNYVQAIAFAKDALGSFSAQVVLYPLFNVYQSSIINIVEPSVAAFQTITVVFNFFVILSFYAMASQYLRQYGDHTPAIATLIWASFAGFGWLAYFTNFLSNSSLSTLTLISQANAYSYGDITWRRNFFFLSMEVSFSLVFAVLYFLKRNDLSKRTQILLFTLLIVPIPLMHPYALYFLLFVLLSFLVICSKDLRQQLNSVGISLIAASFAMFPLCSILSSRGLQITPNSFTFAEFFTLGLVMVIVTLVTKAAPIKLRFPSFKAGHTRLILLLICFLYLTCILLWFSGIVPFDFKSLNVFGYVPLFLFPVKLGMTGLLALGGIYLLFESKKVSGSLKAFIFSLLLLIVFSITLGSLQMNYVSEFSINSGSAFSETIRRVVLSFREERMFEVIKIPLAIIASLALSSFITTKVKLRNNSLSQTVLTLGLVSIILLSGFSSTLLGFTYYQNTLQNQPLSSSELSMINKLQKNLYSNGKAIMIGLQTPSAYLTYTGAIAIATESTVAWQSKCPEIPLFLTRYSATTPTLIYLDNVRDFPKVNDYAGNYLEHFVNMSSYLENDEVQIKEITDSSIPSPNSSTALIVPYDSSKMSIIEPIYHTKNRQYTIASLFFQQGSQSLNVYKEPINYNGVDFDEQTAYFDGKQSYIRISGAEINSDKIQINFNYQPLNITQVQVIASQFDWGTPSKKSWEIAQYGQSIVFKLSSDGVNEEVVTTPDVLQIGEEYTVTCKYDGLSMQIFVNNILLATGLYDGGIFDADADITIGSQLYNNKPVSFENMKLDYIEILNNTVEVNNPLFNAYDLLSSIGLNYTTIISGDPAIDTYKTLVVPYDDLTTENLLTNLGNNPESAVNSVIVINTNGYGPLSNLFGTVSSKKISANTLELSQSFNISSVDVQKIIPNNKTTTLAQYADKNQSSPLIMITNQGSLTLIYINIYPMLSLNTLINSDLAHALAEKLYNYVAPCDEAAISSWFDVPSLLFTSFQANGTICISCDALSSIILPENQTLDMNTLGKFRINSTEISVHGGYGFYTTITAVDPSILLQDTNETWQISGNVTFLVRQPKIDVAGTIQFSDFYMLHPITVYSDGRVTSVSGNLSLDIYLSDKYTIALPYDFQSSTHFEYNLPIISYSERDSFLLAIPCLLLGTILIIPVMIIQRGKEVAE